MRLAGLRRCVLALCAIAATAGAHASFDTATRHVEDARWLPSVGQARIAALGFDAVLGDFYWLEAMHLVGSVRGNVEPLRAGDREPDRAGHRPRSLGRSSLPLRGDLAQRCARGRRAGEPSAREEHRLPSARLAQPPLPGLQPLLPSRRRAPRGRRARARGGPRRCAELPRAAGGEAARRRGQSRRGRSAARRAREHDDRRVRQGALSEVARRDRDGAASRGASTRRASTTGGGIAAISSAWKICSRDPRRCWRALPPAHPHFPGFGWVLDPETGQITSSFYGTRYRLYHQKTDAPRLERQRLRSNAVAAGRG